MVHALVRLLNFHMLALKLPTIRDDGSIIFIIHSENYLYIRFLSDNTNSLMSTPYQKPNVKSRTTKIMAA